MFSHMFSSCAASPVYKTRIMAASAVCPLVANEHFLSVLQMLLGNLRECSLKRVSHNTIHGSLLQVAKYSRLAIASNIVLPLTFIPQLQYGDWLFKEKNMRNLSEEILLVRVSSGLIPENAI